MLYSRVVEGVGSTSTGKKWLGCLLMLARMPSFEGMVFLPNFPGGTAQDKTAHALGRT
jgi:hypothetical protein